MHKKFVYYQTRAQYDTDVLLTGNSQIVFPDQIIFIEDTGEIITHGTNFLNSPNYVTITSTEPSIAVAPNTIYTCSNMISSLTITSVPNSNFESTIIFTPGYGSLSQQDQLCPITLPSGKTLKNFTEEEYTYNKQAIISMKFGLLVFGQDH